MRFFFATKIWLIIALFFGTVPIFSLSEAGVLPVFPGAEGFGSRTSAGRGGKILRVTNLADSGEGSLRFALEAAGPRIIVFEISGTIIPRGFLVVRDPFLTIAGQTAPAPGITVRGGIILNTHDVLVQHLRFRPGKNGPEDGVRIQGPGAFNIVLDHLSVSWSRDENISTFQQVYDVTISNCLIAEGLGKGCYNLLVGDKTHRISIFRNLLANGNRNPRIDGNVSALVVNNLCHNSVGTFSVIGGYPSGRRLPSFVTFIGNVGIPGNNTMEGKALVGTNKLAGGSKLYFSNNLYKGEIYSGGKEFLVDIPPVPAKGISIVDCLQVEDLILQTAGARPAERDLVDSRIIRQVRARTGKIIDTPAEVGGWPDMAVNFRQIILPSQPQADDDGDGYTNIEEVLHRMSDRILRHF